jgi:hypothetical protein
MVPITLQFYPILFGQNSTSICIFCEGGGKVKWKNDNTFIFGKEIHLGFLWWKPFLFWVKNNQKVTTQMIVQHGHLENRA